MQHQLPPLPYPMNAFEPKLSKESFEYHYGKHHKAYVDKLNKLIIDTPFENSRLEEIVLKSEGKLFNNAAQAWNHSFFWNCLSPDRVKISSDELKNTLNDTFGSNDQFAQEWKSKGVDAFGSGWVWLTMDPNTHSIQVEATHDADNPLRHGRIPLLTCDLWEHAYYIDYRNARDKFLETFVQLINWDFVARNFQEAREGVGLGIKAAS